MTEKEISLIEVLEDYANQTHGENNFALLKEFIKRYPQFSQQLTDFAADSDLLKYAPLSEISAEEEARHIELSRQTLQNFLANRTAEIESLTAIAKAKGLKKKDFARRLGLTVSLVMYLEKRRLEFATIPETIIEKIAEVLQTASEKVAEYLKQTPNFATDASFKNQTRPEEIEQKSFSQAVREDQTLSAEEKQNLLTLTKE